MIVTVPGATRSVRIWAKGDSTVIEIDGLAEHSPMGALFGTETWRSVEAPAPRHRRLRIPSAAAIAVVGAAFVVAVGIRVMGETGRSTHDDAALSAGQAEYAQPSAPSVFPSAPAFAQETAAPARTMPTPAPAHAAASPNAAFGLD